MAVAVMATVVAEMAATAMGTVVAMETVAAKDNN
jgi:hypothetical protein